MRSFYFIRHGQTDWNAIGRMQGQSDIPLNAVGLAQAQQASQRFVGLGIQKVISSPLSRAAVTAQIICDRIKAPLHFDDRLKERCFGVIEGMLQTDIRQADPKTLFSDDMGVDWQGHYLPKEAETIDAVAARAVQAVQQALDASSEEKCLFVAHGSWFRALVHQLTNGLKISSDNAVPYFCQLINDAWHIDILTKN